jgi:hypothetical protein
MISTLRAVTIATVALGCALALLSIQLMRPKPLSIAGLGVEWQQDGRNPDGLHQESSQRTRSIVRAKT